LGYNTCYNLWLYYSQHNQALVKCQDNNMI
jgi:hypothetical protein